MKKTKVRKFPHAIVREVGKLSGHIATKDRDGKDFQIPVLDVGDGDYTRYLAEKMIKAANRENGSRFFQDGNRLKVRRVNVYTA